MIGLQTNPIALPDSVPSLSKELSMMKSMPFDDFLNTVVSGMVKFAISLAIAIVVFYVGKLIIKKIYGIVAGIMIRRKADVSLSTFVLSLINILLYFILIVTVIGILGINTSSFIALFASAGVAIGMALSGTLQNFAGGVLILLLKPYRINDYIEAQGFAGTVTEIQIFNTIICTPDNKSIIIPNGGLSTGSINNWSREDYRRVEWTVGISYGDNVDNARSAILDMFASDERIVKKSLAEDREQRREQRLAEGDVETSDNEKGRKKKKTFFRRMFSSGHDEINSRLAALRMKEEKGRAVFVPVKGGAPTVNVSQLASSSVDLTVRAWVKSEQYWPVYFEYNERFYNELPSHGINFPFPQVDVHLPRQ